MIIIKLEDLKLIKGYSKGFRFKETELGVFNTKETLPLVEKFKKTGRVLGLTNGAFSLIDIIHILLKEIGKGDVVCATWSAGIKDVNQVKWLLNENMVNSFILLTDRSYVTRQHKYAMAIVDLFGEENIRTSIMHAKFVLLKIGDRKISIRSSMNLNNNRTCELFEIEESAEIFDFLNDYVKSQFDYNIETADPNFKQINRNMKRYFEEKAEKEGVKTNNDIKETKKWYE